MKLLGCLLLCALSSWGLAAQSLLLRPYRANGWAEKLTLADAVTLSFSDHEQAGVCDLFAQIDALRVIAARRAQAEAQWQELVEESTAAPNDADWRFEFVWQGRAYPFDKKGRFILGCSFDQAEAQELIARFEAFYQKCFAVTSYAADLKVSKTANQRPKKATATIPVFAGFEDARYQQHDALILRLVEEFNANPSAWAGADEGVVLTIPPLKPALIKSQMIEECGGNGPRSLEAWKKDPLQVNVPGDWTEVKLELGLKRPAARNEGSLEKNVRAAIKYLVRKGFGKSGKAVHHRPDAYFDSWRTALQRYNGRNDSTDDGRRYRVAYADRILRRAASPKVFVPINGDK